MKIDRDVVPENDGKIWKKNNYKAWAGRRGRKMSKQPENIIRATQPAAASVQSSKTAKSSVSKTGFSPVGFGSKTETSISP